jgi:hypothetical protein
MEFYRPPFQAVPLPLATVVSAPQLLSSPLLAFKLQFCWLKILVASGKKAQLRGISYFYLSMALQPFVGTLATFSVP